MDMWKKPHTTFRCKDYNDHSYCILLHSLQKASIGQWKYHDAGLL